MPKLYTDKIVSESGTAFPIGKVLSFEVLSREAWASAFFVRTVPQNQTGSHLGFVRFDYPKGQQATITLAFVRTGVRRRQQFA